MGENVSELLDRFTSEAENFLAQAKEWALLKTELTVAQTKRNKSILELERLMERLSRAGYSKDSSMALFQELRTASNPLELLPKHKQIRLLLAGEDRGKLEDFRMTALFDFPDLLRIHVSIPGFDARVTDITASLGKDLKNFSHPIILAAFDRYLHAAPPVNRNSKKTRKTRNGFARLAPKDAEYCIQELIRSVSRTTPSKADPLLRIASLVHVRKLGSDYFDAIARILKSSGFKYYRTNSNRLMQVRIKLKEQFPESDHAEVFQWLENRIRGVGFPSHADAESLQNDFLAWKWNVKRSSAKVYASRARRLAEMLAQAGPLFEEGEVENTINRVFERLMPSKEFPGSTSLDGLVFDSQWESSLPDN
jgi:hypothetical protein